MNTKYIIKDWAGNVMKWAGSPYSHEDYASEAISMHALDEMNNDGHDTVWVEDGGEFDEEVFYTYCGEYFITEIEED